MSAARGAAVLLVVLCLCAFFGVGENGFINLDDRAYITENAMVARGMTMQGVLWAFTTTRAGNWHPLTWLSHMVDVQLFGMAPGRHHQVSLALHICSALLLFAALNIMAGAPWRSFFATALFALHPMRVESVAWASERKDVLAMVFALLALLVHLRGLRRPGGQARLWTGCFYALALLAKPMPVTFPFLLLLLDWWPLGRWRPGGDAARGAWETVRGALPPRALWREKAPLFLLAALSSAITFVVQSRAGAVAPGESIPVVVRTANAVVSYAEYLIDTLWPRDLSIFYPHPYVAPAWPTLAASLILLAAVTIIVWRRRHRRPFVLVGWFWYLGALLPMIGLIQVGGQARADRYTYLPHSGLFILAVWGIGRAARQPRLRYAFVVGGAIVVLAFAAATAALVPQWRTSVALFTRAVSVVERQHPDNGQAESPALAFIYNCLGLAYYDAGEYAQAIPRYRRALALNPFSYVSMNNLAKALEATGQEMEANALYVRALNDPHLAEPRFNLGMMLLKRENPEDAIELFRQGLAIDPIDAMGNAALGAALATTGRLAEAEAALREAVTLAPGFEPARFNLGKLLLEQRRFGEAIDQLRESIRLQPNQEAAHFLLREAIAGARMQNLRESGP